MNEQLKQQVREAIGYAIAVLNRIDDYPAQDRAREKLMRALAALAAPSEQTDIAAAMRDVAEEHAHGLALELECILSDYSGKWYDSAMNKLAAYRDAMNAIHERESPTFMGEPAIRALKDEQPAECIKQFNAPCVCGQATLCNGKGHQSEQSKPAEQAPSERELDLYDEIECDLPALFGRASAEGHETGQRLAKELQAKMQQARQQLSEVAPVAQPAPTTYTVDGKVMTSSEYIDYLHQQLKAAQSAHVQAMVNRFLGWPLPKTFAPDCDITFKPLNYPYGWPIGTNLFTADEAKAMFEYCLQDAHWKEQSMTTDIDKMRAEFESWAKESGLGRTYRSTEPGYTDEYADSHTQQAWGAYQAGRAAAEQDVCLGYADALHIQNYERGLAEGVYVTRQPNGLDEPMPIYRAAMKGQS